MTTYRGCTPLESASGHHHEATTDRGVTSARKSTILRKASGLANIKHSTTAFRARVDWP